MSKVVVTGGTGFIGPHLVRQLIAQGDEVVCLVRSLSRAEPLERLGVRLVIGDVTAPKSLPPALKGADVVYHLAGVTKTLRAVEFGRVNALGVQNVLEAARALPNPPVVVLVSSLAAAGPSPDGRPRTEADAPVPVSRYGHSKRAGELAAERAAGHVPITVLRPPIVFGEGDTGMLQMIRPIARRGLHFVPGFTQRHFSLIHASDLSAAMVQSARRGIRLTPSGADKGCGPAGYYFVAAEECPSYVELGGLIAAAVGRGRWRPVRTPLWFTWVVGGAAEAAGRIRRKAGIFNLDKAREATAGSWTCSADLARLELGWSCEASLADRLRQTVDWYAEQGWL